MAYLFYLDKMLCPVTPSKLQIKIINKNKSVILINEGEINILKTPGLSEVGFDAVFPNTKYPFAKYKKGFKRAKYYLDKLETLKTSKKPFQFIVTRKLPNKKRLFNTNIKVSLEDYQIKEDAKDGFDVTVTIKLKQYKPYGTKVITIKTEEDKPKTPPPQEERPAETAPTPPANTSQTYTVVKGDCLWKIARRYYGSGAKYNIIFNANRDKIKNPNLIYPGQVLTIPSG